jgi:allantoinase
MDEGDFLRAWGGIASVQYGLSIMWTAGQAYHIKYAYVILWILQNVLPKVCYLMALCEHVIV